MEDTALDLNLLTVFVAVVQTSSFSKAAKRLGLSKGTVSRSIARLEDAVGAELLHRTTHAVAVSTAGAALYERSAVHLAALTDAVKGLPERAELPSGELRLTAPHDFGTVVLPAILAQFALLQPLIRFDVRLTNDVVDMVAEGFDAGIRFAVALKDSNLRARRLGSLAVRFYAAPGYLARRGRPRALGDDRHDWVLAPNTAQHLGMPADTKSRFACHDFLFNREILREGGGVGTLPSFLAEPYERQGLLERVDVPGLPTDIVGSFFLVYPSSGQIPKKLAAFRDYLVEHLGGGEDAGS